MEGKLAKSATVYSNDPANKTIRLNLTGEVKPYISVKPRHFVYISTSQSTPETRKVRISAVDDEKFKITDVKSSLGQDVIKYDLKTIEDGKDYELTIQTNNTKVGRYSGDITLITDHPQKSDVVLKVNVDVRGEIMAIPQYANFGNISPEKMPNVSFQRRLLVRRENNKEFQLTHTQYDENKYKIEVKKPANNGPGYEILIVLRAENFSKGPFSDELHFKTDVESQPILTVPVTGNIQ